jgi:hypothetical protein
MKALTSTLAAGLLLIALGCTKDPQSPSEVESAPALATTQTLTFIVLTAGRIIEPTVGVTTFPGSSAMERPSIACDQSRWREDSTSRR